MPRGDKKKYSGKQKRQAEHIAEGYEDQGVGEKEAKRRAWATVNKTFGGGKMPGGSGRGQKENHAPARKGGKKGGAASVARSAEEWSASARKAAKLVGGTRNNWVLEPAYRVVPHGPNTCQGNTCVPCWGLFRVPETHKIKIPY